MWEYWPIQNVKKWTEIIVYWTPYYKAKQIAELYGVIWYKNLILVDDIKQLKWIKIDDYLQLFALNWEYPKINFVDDYTFWSNKFSNK